MQNYSLKQSVNLNYIDMTTYSIETIRNTEFIIADDLSIKLKVIPPNKRDCDNYEPYMVVSAIFEDCRPEISEDDFATEELYLDAFYKRANDNGGGPEYDFEGVGISFADTDSLNPNKDKWFNAINYYCQLKLDTPVVDLSPYHYDCNINY